MLGNIFKKLKRLKNKFIFVKKLKKMFIKT